MSTLTKVERQALEDLFLSLGERRNFLDKVKASKKEMRRFLKNIFSLSKKSSTKSLPHL